MKSRRLRARGLACAVVVCAGALPAAVFAAGTAAERSLAAAATSEPGSAPANPEEPGDDSFDPSQYPERDLTKLLEQNPCKSGESYELKDIQFSARLVYREKRRAAPPKDLELVRRWTASLNAEDQAASFDRELSVEDGRKNLWWMPLPKTLTPYMEQDLRDGDAAVFYMSFVGCADGAPMIGIEEYSVPEDPQLEEGAATYIT